MQIQNDMFKIETQFIKKSKFCDLVDSPKLRYCYYQRNKCITKIATKEHHLIKFKFKITNENHLLSINNKSHTLSRFEFSN